MLITLNYFKCNFLRNRTLDGVCIDTHIHTNTHLTRVSVILMNYFILLYYYYFNNLIINAKI